MTPAAEAMQPVLEGLPFSDGAVPVVANATNRLLLRADEFPPSLLEQITAPVRWDSGISVGDEITLFYDSLLGKLIVWGASRDDALQRMRRALDELAIVGVGTNQGFHRRLLRDEAFCAGDFDIQFLDRRSDLMEAAPDQSLLSAVAVAAAMAEDEARESRRPIVATDGWQARRVWLQTARLEGLR